MTLAGTVGLGLRALVLNLRSAGSASEVPVRVNPRPRVPARRAAARRAALLAARLAAAQGQDQGDAREPAEKAHILGHDRAD